MPTYCNVLLVLFPCVSFMILCKISAWGSGSTHVLVFVPSYGFCARNKSFFYCCKHINCEHLIWVPKGDCGLRTFMIISHFLWSRSDGFFCVLRVKRHFRKYDFETRNESNYSNYDFLLSLCKQKTQIQSSDFL